MSADLPAVSVATDSARCECGKPLSGRSGRKFCSDACRWNAWDRAHPRQHRLKFEPPPEPVLPIRPTPKEILRAQKPQTVKTLRMLQEAGERGVTTGEFLRCYIARFSARLGELRAVGWRIRGARERDLSWRFWLEGRE